MERELQLQHLDTLLAELTLETTPLHNLHFPGEISAAELNILGLSGNNKEYDGTTAATASGIATLSGVIGADDVILGGDPVFTFASPEVGTGITITTSGYTISGTDSGNYVLTQPILSGDITSNLNNSDHALKNQIKLYPNPTKDVILNTGNYF